MTLRGDEELDEDLLIRFLNGELPEEEAARLEEGSVADDELAARLDVVEDDLADAYVRGELDPAARARFEATYLRSKRGRAKVAAAAALLARERRESAGAARRFGADAASGWFALAAAAGLVVVASWTLMESRTPAATDVVQAPPAGAEPARGEIAEREPAAATPAIIPPAEGAGRTPGTATTASPAIVSFVLLPQTRGANDTTVVRVPRGSVVRARLRLEFDEMARYAVALKEGDERTLWRADRVESTRRGDERELEVRLPADLLRSGAHTFEVSGIADDGSSEFVGSYAFRVVLE